MPNCWRGRKRGGDLSCCELDVLWPLCRRFWHSFKGTKMPPPPHDCFAGACLGQKTGTKLWLWRADMWHVLRALRFAFSSLGSPWLVWIVQVSVSKCKYIVFRRYVLLTVVYIEIWRNCARLLVRIVVGCGWKTRLCMSPAASFSNALLISDYF